MSENVNEVNEVSVDEEVDMGSVSAEDPIEAVAATAAPAKKERKPRQPKAEKEPKAPAAPKTPVVGGYAKLPDFTVTFGGSGVDDWEALWNDDKCPAKKHHQRQVIVEVFQEAKASGAITDSSITVDKIVTAIEGSPSLLERMRTNQPVHRCVLYHLNQLEIMGLVTTNRPRRAAKAEKPADATAQEDGTTPLGENVDEIVGEEATSE